MECLRDCTTTIGFWSDSYIEQQQSVAPLQGAQKVSFARGLLASAAAATKHTMVVVELWVNRINIYTSLHWTSVFLVWAWMFWASRYLFDARKMWTNGEHIFSKSLWGCKHRAGSSGDGQNTRVPVPEVSARNDDAVTWGPDARRATRVGQCAVGPRSAYDL